MKQIKILGSGCTKCRKTAELIERIAQQQGVAAEITKVTDPETIMGYGVMSTPAVVIDEAVVHSGSIPPTAEVQQWLSE